MTIPLYLVDASIYIFRAYFSMPDAFYDKSGNSVNAVYGYASFLIELLAHKPKYVSFAFDESLNTCYRNEIYPEYKANRDLPDENLEYQLAKCQEITRLLGIHSLSLKHYEADDIIGTLYSMFARKRPAIIVTRDKDLGQLLGKEDRLWDFAANDYMGPAEVEEKFGVKPTQIADFLALAGDSVDNIPGAPGIGAKSAATLLQNFGSIDRLYKSLDKVPTIEMRGAKRVAATLQEHESMIRTFQSITRIKTDIAIEVSLQDLKRTPQSKKSVAAFCEEMKFGKRVIDGLVELSNDD